MAWIPALLWIGVIAAESSDFFSSAHTGTLLYALLSAVLGGIDLPSFLAFHSFLRKVGHVLGYGLLSLLLFRAWRDTLPSPLQSRWMLRWAGAAVLGTLLVASLDEWHQSYLPSRTGTLSDVILDAGAGLAVQFILWRALAASRHSAIDLPAR
jgi:VanZ family protein